MSAHDRRADFDKLRLAEAIDVIERLSRMSPKEFEQGGKLMAEVALGVISMDDAAYESLATSTPIAA